MNKKELMRLMVKDPEAIREIVLTDDQLAVYREVNNLGSMTSKKLTRLLDCSVASASARLTRLYEAQYLKRVNHRSNSGGKEFVYSVAI